VASRQSAAFDETCGIGYAEADRVGAAVFPLLLQ
jgi:hypothetical protein